MSAFDDFIYRTKKFALSVYDGFVVPIQLLGGIRRYAAREMAFMESFTAQLKESESEQLLLMIARALSAWATMEEFLVVIVAEVLPARGEQAGLIMYSILNFGTWLSLIDELMALDPRLAKPRARYNKIKERIKRIKDLRDRLAHHSVSNEKARLQSSQFDLRQKTRDQPPLSISEIFEFLKTVVVICDDLKEFCEYLEGVMAKMPCEGKYPGQACDRGPEPGSQ